MYKVELTKEPIQNDFRSDYFPRKFKCKTDATELVEEVKRKGGDAKITKYS